MGKSVAEAEGDAIDEVISLTSDNVYGIGSYQGGFILTDNLSCVGVIIDKEHASDVWMAIGAAIAKGKEKERNSDGD